MVASCWVDRRGRREHRRIRPLVSPTCAASTSATEPYDRQIRIVLDRTVNRVLECQRQHFGFSGCCASAAVPNERAPIAIHYHGVEDA